MIVLRNAEKLQNYHLRHSKSQRFDDFYKLRPFTFIGKDPTKWSKQLLYDLKHLYIKDGLELIGAFFEEDTTNDFTFLYYERPSYYKDKEFQMSIEVLYDDVT